MYTPAPARRQLSRARVSETDCLGKAAQGSASLGRVRLPNIQALSPPRERARRRHLKNNRRRWGYVRASGGGVGPGSLYLRKCPAVSVLLYGRLPPRSCARRARALSPFSGPLLFLFLRRPSPAFSPAGENGWQTPRRLLSLIPMCFRVMTYVGERPVLWSVEPLSCCSCCRAGES